METGKNLEEVRQLEIAAFFDANNTYPYIFQLLGYRKAIAQRMLKSSIFPGTLIDLKDQFKHTNQQLKKLLGLEE